MKPIKQIEVGKTLHYTSYIHDEEEKDKVINTIKERLTAYYNDRKEKCDEGIEFGDFEFVVSGPDLKGDPLDQRLLVTIKWPVKGRAYIIKRKFSKSTNPVLYYPNKKSVPKRKRGKPMPLYLVLKKVKY